MDQMVGEIRVISFDWAPAEWAICDGATLSIETYKILFSVIGTTYGGDGVTTFKLPDFRGRAPLGMGAGQGLSPIVVGELGGVEQVVLTMGQLPNHNHVATAAVPATTSAATLTNPQGAVLAVVGADPRSPIPAYAPRAAGSVTLAQGSVQVQYAGFSEPVTVRNPYLGINFVIALAGIYPIRAE